MSASSVAVTNTAIEPLAIPADVDMSHVKSNLYCVQCNRMLQDAVEVACCHALYCASCVPTGASTTTLSSSSTSDAAAATAAVAPGACATTTCDSFPVCVNCGREILTAATPNYPVRRLVASIPIPCTQDGCSEIVAVGLMATHIATDCAYASVLCRFYSRGCAAALLRKDLFEHETKYCVFRDVPCPQGCPQRGLQWRELSTHFDDSCPKTLRECPVKCGALVERTALSDHLQCCPLRPVYCPYIAMGCTMTRPLRTRDMEEHMACSLHSHLQLVESQLRVLQKVDDRTKSLMSILSPQGVHDWDPATIRCVGRWEAQPNTIQACAVVDGFLATGCEAGTILFLHPYTGTVVHRTADGPDGTAPQPVSSLLALSGGRLVVGRKFQLVELFTDGGRRRAAATTLHPKRLDLMAGGVMSLATARVSRQVHLASYGEARRRFLHLELYAVATSADEALEHEGHFEVLFAAVEDRVVVLDASNLETVEDLAGRHVGVITSLVVDEQERFLCSGGADGSVRVASLRERGFPSLYWLQCVGGPMGVTALCVHPDPHGVITFWGTGAVPQGAQSETSHVSVLERERSARGIPLSPFANVAAAEALPQKDSTNGLGEDGGEPELVLCIGGADGSVQFWDARGSLSVNHSAQSGHRGAVVTLLPVDGSHVVSGGVDEYWRLWDGMGVTSRADLPGSTYCAVAHDKVMYAAGSQGCVRMWTATSMRYNPRRLAPQLKVKPL